MRTIRPHWCNIIPAAALLAAGALSQAAIQENMVKNPGFEEAASAGDFPAFWSGEVGPQARFELSDDNPHSGRFSLAQAVEGSSQVWIQSDLIAVIPGQPYTVRVWYRCADDKAGPPLLQIQAEDGSNLIDWTLPAKTSWSMFSQSFLPGKGDERIRVALINYYREGQTIFWDDVSLTPALEAGDEAVVESPVALVDEAQTTEAARPYELGDRKPDFEPTVLFSGVKDWKIRGLRGAEAKASLSAQQRIWGDRSLRVSYRFSGEDKRPKSEKATATTGRLAGLAAPGGGTVEIVPPAPIAIEKAFDAVQLWVNGDNYYKPSQPVVTVRLIDGDGKPRDVVLGLVNWMYWFLMFGTVPDDLKPPVKFDRMIVSNITNDQPMDLYFDALAFIEQPRDKIAANRRKEPAPFPTREETLLPSVKQPVRNSVRKDGNAYVLECSTPDGPVTYRYEPRTGKLSDVSVSVPGEGTWKPLNEAGPILAGQGGIDGRAVQAKPVSCQIENGAVVSRWEVRGDGEPLALVYRLEPRGKSLVIDVEGDRPLVSSFSAGRISGAPASRVFWPPYMNICRHPQPHILITKKHFASIFFDWYHTNSSAFYGAGDITSQGARIFDRAAYEPNLDGERSTLRERIFFTVSNHFDEVLFNIPNPPSPLRATLRENILVSRQNYAALGRNYYRDKEVPFWKRFKAYGVDHLVIRLHADFWRTRETFTFKDQASPEKGGDEAAIDYVNALKKLGYRVGLYTDYLLISPLSEAWNPDMAALDSHGDRAEQAFATYFLKPTEALALQEEWARRLHEKFGTSASYCDQMTQANSSWIDYDPRVPGGIKQRTVLEEWGRLLLNERIAHDGPCYSEGGYHALWAGLCDGNYAQTFQPDAPAFPSFALLKLHPLQADVGYDLEHSAGDDRQIALQIIYGNGGMLWAGPWGAEASDFNVPLMLRNYFMMQQLQYRYIMEPVESISYFDGSQLVGADDAFRSGAYRRGQVQTVYQNGLTTIVNANKSENWEVQAVGRSFQLPPNGWVAWDRDGFLEYSATMNGRRRDFVGSDKYVYFDGFGAIGQEGGVESAGQVIVIKEKDGLRVIPYDPKTPVRFNLAELGLRKAEQVALSYVDEVGKVLSESRPHWPADGWISFQGPEGSFAVEVTPVKNLTFGDFNASRFLFSENSINQHCPLFENGRIEASAKDKGFLCNFSAAEHLSTNRHASGSR